MPPALARVIAVRGITTAEKARGYFRDKLADLADPLRMDGMQEAAQRLAHAIQLREPIMIYGDFDADGVTSVALMKTFLDRCQAVADYFIIDRQKDGRGLGKRGIDHAVQQGARLLLVVDCGIKDVEMTAYANNKGLDVIICDHHLPGATLPEAAAIINPHKKSCSYPFPELSACGVAFRLAQATTTALSLDPRKLDDLLEFVAISTVADIMPLQGENRILVREGLKRLRESERPGIQALASIAKRNLAQATANDIGWYIAPRINAAQRMGNASVAVELLLTKDALTAKRKAEKLHEFNTERGEVSKAVLREARKKAKIQMNGAHKGALVLHGEGWHPGVLGIVAGNIVKEFLRPTIMLRVANGIAKGSARSFSHINLYEALCECSDLLEHFGGHAQAAGLALSTDNIPLLHQRLSGYVEERLRPEDFEKTAEYDAEVSVSDIDDWFVKILKHIEPCGKDNERPRFVSRNLVAIAPHLLNNRHLKFKAQQTGEGSDKKLQCIFWNAADQFSKVTGNQAFDMLYAIEENHFRGKTITQLKVEDIRPSSSA